ncbi:DUF402 domain-containing protein [Longispora sp. K20-0274]|uniref:DUF402 domain-containing protein n=1 Tax=Longispora sp. K20-0274 TaxID=3088255 RepID=UPI00399A7E61
MFLTPGESALRRIWRGGRIVGLEPVRVVADDEAGLRLWLAPGSTILRRTALDGSSSRGTPLAELIARPSVLTESLWGAPGVLMLLPPGAACSVWWFLHPDEGFQGWYVNLERPAARWRSGGLCGVDSADDALDVLVAPDRAWSWKDEDEFAERTGHPWYWDEAGAAEIRAEGERMIGLAEAGEFPFDGRWRDFRPEPTWGPATLPAGWDLPPQAF